MRRQPVKKGFFASAFKKIIGGALILELACASVGYLGYVKANTSRDSRLYLKKNWPFLLETYYQIGETFDKDNKIREVDSQVWAQLANDRK